MQPRITTGKWHSRCDGREEYCVARPPASLGVAGPLFSGRARMSSDGDGAGRACPSEECQQRAASDLLFPTHVERADASGRGHTTRATFSPFQMILFQRVDDLPACHLLLLLLLAFWAVGNCRRQKRREENQNALLFLYELASKKGSYPAWHSHKDGVTTGGRLSR